MHSWFPIDFMHERQPKPEYGTWQIYDWGKSAALDDSIVD
jgi:hypothetical protein